jgi:membrane-associated phospholipid phosphatase
VLGRQVRLLVDSADYRDPALDRPELAVLHHEPPFPSYVSGHLTTSGAASTVLAAVFPAKAEALAAMAEEAAVSRLYGGIHYRSDNEVRLALGRRIGQVAVRTYNMHAG